jgi:hypothetical protein
MSGSKLLDGNPLYVQFVYFMSGSKIFTWSTDKLNIQGDSIQNFWTKHEVDKLNIQGVSI